MNISTNSPMTSTRIESGNATNDPQRYNRAPGAAYTNYEMSDEPFHLAEALEKLLGEIPGLEEKLRVTQRLAAEFRAAVLRHEAAQGEQTKLLSVPLPKKQIARRAAEAERKALDARIEELYQQRVELWKQHSASTAFLGAFMAQVDFVLQRLPLTPEWQAFPDEIRRLEVEIAQLGSWEERARNFSFDLLKTRLRQMLELARVGAANRPAVSQVALPGLPASTTPSDEAVAAPSTTAMAPGIDQPEAALTAKLKLQQSRATTRQAVVMPILQKKRWTRGKWATRAGVGKNSVYGYLDGRRNPTAESRRAMAEVLELKAEDLPE